MQMKKSADQPAHAHSLISFFVMCSQESVMNLIFIIWRYCYLVDNVMSYYDHTLHNTFGGNKLRHNDVRYNKANFHGNKLLRR